MPKNTLISLAESIRSLSPELMGADDAQDAARNLAGFFSLLLEIDREQSSLKQEGGKGNASN